LEISELEEDAEMSGAEGGIDVTEDHRGSVLAWCWPVFVPPREGPCGARQRCIVHGAVWFQPTSRSEVRGDLEGGHGDAHRCRAPRPGGRSRCGGRERAIARRERSDRSRAGLISGGLVLPGRR
jgi:hypothetical protein